MSETNRLENYNWDRSTWIVWPKDITFMEMIVSLKTGKSPNRSTNQE